MNQKFVLYVSKLAENGHDRSINHESYEKTVTMGHSSKSALQNIL